MKNTKPKRLPSDLPSEIIMRCEDAGYTQPTWSDIKYQCESGLDLCVESEDFYTTEEKIKFRPMFQFWLNKANKELADS
jgi:hypothetical protein